MSLKTALAEVNNAILDLQAADYNTYERPLKRLDHALNAEELRETNEALKAGVDFDAFIAKSDGGKGMMGSASLKWPSDREEELGLTLVLIQRAAAEPSWFMNFSHHWYYSGNKLIAGIRKLTGAVIIPFGRDYRSYLETRVSIQSPVQTEPTDLKRIFIVHGHDDATREMVARFVTTVGFEPVILHEQASRGMTIPEKLVANSNVGFAIVLLTPDDIGRSKQQKDLQDRARQNVVLELGYFVGKLGRDKVCALKKGIVEIPSDYLGVVYTELDDAGGWKVKLGQELQAAGYEIEWNKIMGRG
ncbi:nucleotide-binding protein [Asticcacaulis sp. 201]|uniref:nucleotide-binding protein n=1 Tax=Asticcacaulis sp. 201 TaxID=3028787 RepID=UPI002916E7F3|nr:nucleotide-binding protein [Asticcacaulis sp. 201]MDV6333165.1 nucleotide-binding protein [Asticcacaulis sp. 201]